MPIPTNKLKDVAFSSLFTYEQLHMRGSFTTTLGGPITSIPHDLGYIPYLRVWADWGGLLSANNSPNAPINIIVNPLALRVDIQAFANNEGSFGNSVKIYYRIYKDKVI